MYYPLLTVKVLYWTMSISHNKVIYQYYISHSHSVGVDHYTFSHHNILTLPNERVSDKNRAGRSVRRKSKTMEIDEKGETHHPQCLSRLLHSVDHHTWAPAGEGRHEKRETGR